jgi:phospholipid-binding lipoprotein MlaA
MKHLSHFILFSLITFSTVACSKKTNTQDPYESFNRQMFKFNSTVDKTIYRPVAIVYDNVIPKPLKMGLTNFFNNLFTPDTFINDLLQGKVHYAMMDIARVIINSTIGIGGLYDVAAKIGLPYHDNDFGKTFAYYSHNKKSAYFVIPFLGPSTFRDAFALPFDAAASPLTYLSNRPAKYGLTALYYINLRSKLLPLDKMIDTAFDPYAAVRNAYLQKRDAAVINNTKDYQPLKKHEKEQTLDDFVNQNKAQPTQTEAPPKDDFSIDAPTKK